MTERNRASSQPTRADVSAARTAALRELSEAGKLYERYLVLTKLNEFPIVDVSEAEGLDQPPTTDRPVGLVIDPSTTWFHPMGLTVSPTR